jgi:hypothetical protein
MEVREAVGVALKYVNELFGEEGAVNIGLEEVQQDTTGKWLVTVGFSRPWDFSKGALAVFGGAGATVARSYKVVALDYTGEVMSVKNRDS